MKTLTMHFLFPHNIVLKTGIVGGIATTTLEPFLPNRSWLWGRRVSTALVMGFLTVKKGVKCRPMCLEVVLSSHYSHPHYTEGAHH